MENSAKVNFWYGHFTDFSLFFLLCRFMWIMGVSMVISFQSMRRRQMRSITIFAKIIRRTLILFALGLFVSNCKLMMPLNAHATLLASYLSFIFWFFFLPFSFQLWSKTLFLSPHLFAILFFAFSLNLNVLQCLELIDVFWAYKHSGFSHMHMTNVAVLTGWNVVGTQMQTLLTTEYQESYKDFLLATLSLPCSSWLLILELILSW